MVDITTIPTTELEKDLHESKIDVDVCQKALDAGILNYSGGSVQERLQDNQKFIITITKELNRRQGITL